MNIDMLDWLQNWFLSNCDEDWEHGEGIQIETLDNPGWKVMIDISCLDHNEGQVNLIEAYRSDTDWIHCQIVNDMFVGGGGPRNLTEILTVFKDYHKSLFSSNK